jgi:prepilin-type processing-associated H-X9-DG protein
MGFVWAGRKDCEDMLPEPPGSIQWSSDEWVTTYGEDWDNYPRVRGAFWSRGSAKIAQITDGTSNTVAVFENHHWRSKANPGQMNRATAWISPISAIDAADGKINTDYNSNLRGNVNTWDQDTRCTGWTSIHDGGAHALMCDGAVRFVGQNVDWRRIQGAIATGSGSELVGEF